MLDIQHEGVRAIPQNRILVKTDTPHLICGAIRPLTPKHIVLVYQLIAIILGEPIEHLAESVRKNFSNFFAKQLDQRY